MYWECIKCTWFYLSYIKKSRNDNKNRNYNIKSHVYEMKSGHNDKSEWDEKFYLDCLTFYIIIMILFYYFGGNGLL